MKRIHSVTLKKSVSKFKNIGMTCVLYLLQKSSEQNNVGYKKALLCLYVQGANEMGRIANQRVTRTHPKTLNLFIFVDDLYPLYLSKNVAIDYIYKYQESQSFFAFSIVDQYEDCVLEALFFLCDLGQVSQFLCAYLSAKKCCRCLSHGHVKGSKHRVRYASHMQKFPGCFCCSSVIMRRTSLIRNIIHQNIFLVSLYWYFLPANYANSDFFLIIMRNIFYVESRLVLALEPLFLLFPAYGDTPHMPYDLSAFLLLSFRFLRRCHILKKDQPSPTWPLHYTHSADSASENLSPPGITLPSSLFIV